MDKNMEIIDSYEKINPVLRKIMKTVFNSRRNFPVEYLSSLRKEIVNDKLSCQLWFISSGCSHDNHGGCTMCNYGYGKGFHFEQKQIFGSIKEDLKELEGKVVQELVIGPTGSFLDNKEVPITLRREIYTLLSSVDLEHLCFETRCDTITYEKLHELREYVKIPLITIEVGLECTNDWILRNCVNKGQSLAEIRTVVNMIHEMGMCASANISLGIPFVSEKMGIELAVKSVEDAIYWGFDEVVIFPYHIKPGTLLEVLNKNHLYKTISLWSLIETLYQIPRSHLEKLSISWYKNYYGESSPLIIKSPTTCPACEKEVIELLDNFKNKPTREVVEKLYGVVCDCKSVWNMSIKCSEGDYLENYIKVFQKAAEIFYVDQNLVEKEVSYMRESWKLSCEFECK